MKRIADHSLLDQAKQNKNDEFYTLLPDIERELAHYSAHFQGKSVLCNCDDPTTSNFFRYFVQNFRRLGLKKVVASCIGKPGGDLFSPFEPGFYYEYTGEQKATPRIDDVKYFQGDGDFRSAESIALLDAADIVVTNPPFSLFHEFVAMLILYDKSFIIWGNNSAITYKNFFPLIKENKVWLGYLVNQTCVFRLSDDYDKWNEKITKEKNDGKKYGKVPAISVYTNLDIKKRHDKLITWKKFADGEYPKYENYDGIDIGSYDSKGNWQGDLSIIPCDYYGIMGVPITFLDKYNPDQFEIVGCPDYKGLYGADYLGVTRMGEEWLAAYRKQGGTGHYTANMLSLVFYDSNGNTCKAYKRIMIRRKDGSK